MNIQVESLSSNQNGIEYTRSNNGGEESEIEKMSKEDFAKLLCEHSDRNYYYNENEVIIKDGLQVSEDEFVPLPVSISDFINTEINTDYCKECLIKFLESQNKN